MTETKKITLAGIYFALASILCLLEIPVFGFMSIEFSLVVVLMSYFTIGWKYTFWLSITYPWMTMINYFPTSWVGALTLIALNLLVMISLIALKAKDNSYVRMVISILIVSIAMTLLNIVFFNAAWSGFDYSWAFQPEIIITSLAFYIPFNIIKLLIMYVIAIPIIKITKGVING